jgi:hypothetical protein
MHSLRTALEQAEQNKVAIGHFNAAAPTFMRAPK